MNAREQKETRMTLFKELMVLSEQYKHKNNMNEAMKGRIIFIFAGLVLVLSFAACNKDNETTEASTLTKTLL